MTQALNLALFANKLNTSGATDNTGLQNSSITINTTSPITGGATPALGGSMTIAHANSGVAAASYTNANITVNAQGHITAASNGSAATGTVTSVATGNGLQGGTITSTGTLSVACPTVNTVGSYGFLTQTVSTGDVGPGGTKAGNLVFTGIDIGLPGRTNSSAASGTWRCMGNSPTNSGEFITLWCRVS